MADKKRSKAARQAALKALGLPQDKKVGYEEMETALHKYGKEQLQRGERMDKEGKKKGMDIFLKGAGNISDAWKNKTMKLRELRKKLEKM